MMVTVARTIPTVIHIGDINQYQDQSINPVNCSTQNIIVNTHGRDSPLLVCRLPSLIEWILLIIIIVIIKVATITTHKVIESISQLVFKFL